MTNNLNAYHNAFYAKTSDDLKYKKDRCVNNNFEIRFSYHDNDIIICRSYWTDIATIDNENRRVIISWGRYSHTTGTQIDEILRACPADYKIAFVPSENILGDYATKSRICEIMTQAGKDSLDWVNAHDYKVKDRADWLKHLQNIKSVYDGGEFSALYTDAREKMDSRERALAEKRAERGYITRRNESEIQQERREHFERLRAQGVPAIVARCRAKYIEPEYSPKSHAWDISRVFVWSGRFCDKIKTTGGVSFEPRHCESIKDFEQFTKDQRVLSFTFQEIDEKDRFVIGCHRIPRAELESLRQLYTAAKAKHDAKVAA